MAKQILSTGNTGSELVSKFNNNFGDLYGGVYNITEHGCVGDAATDNTTAFTTLLSTIGTNQATIKIPKGRFLIGACTIPANIELVFENGGRIIWKSGATINIHGHINAGHKWIFENESEVAVSLPNIGIHRQEWISPIWFGGKMSGDNADAITNYNAFRSAWNCAERLGNTAMGSSIKFPAGIFIMNGFANNTDGFKLSAKYADISGAGKTKTTIMLASGQNKSLWNTFNNFDFNFRDIGFNGNASGNPTMTDPLISIDYYRVNFENVFITNCTADAIYINEGQTNAVNYHNITITNCGGIGMVFENLINVGFSGMIDIESCLGIMDFKGTGKTYYDSRQQTRAMIVASIYAESVQHGIRIFGLSNIYLKLSMYARSTFNLVHLIYDTTDYGEGARNMPCSNCYIDISQSHDSKVDGSYNGVLIDDQCYNNVVVTNDGLLVKGTDKHRNLITIPGGKPFAQIDRSGDFSGNNYLNNTHPAFNDYNANQTNLAYSVLPEPVAYVSSVGSVLSLEYRGQCQFRLTAGKIPEAKTVYFHALVKGTPGLLAGISCYDVDADEFYDYSRKQFKDITGDSNNHGGSNFYLTGELQYISLAFVIDATHAANRLWFSITPSIQTHTDAGDHMIVYYVNITDNEHQDLVHIRSGNVIGRGDKSFLASTALPPATAMSVGTKNFCPDLGMEVISDGTNWKKPDGTNLA